MTRLTVFNFFRNLKLMIIILGFLLGVLISCSEITKPSEAARIQINGLLDAIEDAVITYEPEKIIAMLHRDFLHNGNDRTAQSYTWQIRLLQYNTMVLQDREITISQISALAAFEMTISSADTTIVTQEPSEQFGDISYFIRDEGRWQLYGNQSY